MVFGIGIGAILSPNGLSAVAPEKALFIAEWLVLPGHLFLNLIQMIVVPLVMSSIILGVGGSGDKGLIKSVGSRVSVYFVLTTTVAVTLGCILALLIRPGRFVDRALVESALSDAPQLPTVAPALPSAHQQIMSLVPHNPLEAALEQSMLQLVTLSIMLGVALLNIDKKRSEPLLSLLESVRELAMEIVGWSMRLAPLAVFGLLAEITTKLGLSAIIAMSAYVGTVLMGLALLFLIYVLIVRGVTGMPVSRFLRGVREVQLLAFSTSSSAAVMPLSIKVAEQELGVRPPIARFLIPLGATVNMDGTAIYQVIAAVFLAQVFGVDMSAGDLFLLSVTTVGASIGSPSTPGVGIVILATVLASFGIPATGIALILGVDRILDMSRTAVNVSGDLAACVVMNRLVPASEPRESTALID